MSDKIGSLGGPGRKTALALVQSKTQLIELLRAAVCLRDSGSYQVTFCVDPVSSIFSDALTSACREKGFEVVHFADFANRPEASKRLSWRRRLRTRAYHLLLDGISTDSLRGKLARILLDWRETDADFRGLAHLLVDYWKLELAGVEQAAWLLSSVKPRLLIVGEDGLGGNRHVVAVARERGTKILVVPYEFSTRRQILLGVAGTSAAIEANRIRNPFDRYLARVYPNWTTEVEGAPLLRFHSLTALASEFHETAPPNPWTVHGGLAHKLAAESERMLAHYRSEDLPRDKLALVGMLAADEMFEVLKQDSVLRLAFEHGKKIQPGATFVLSALPPNYTDDPRVESEFADYRALADFWITTVRSVPCAKCTFQIHPAMQKESVEYISSKVNVTEQGIAALIPRCDILITSVSSIIRLAIACRKPVVNYDVYRFRYPDYIDAPGVFNVSSKAEFEKVVERLTVDECAYAAASAEQREKGTSWGAVDGKAGARLLELANELTR